MKHIFSLLSASREVLSCSPFLGFRNPVLHLSRKNTVALITSVRRHYASASDVPPHSIVTMPALSPTMEKGNLGKWKKAIGDKLTPGDILAEVETDKAQMDFEYNSDEGYIAAFLIPDGTRDINVGTPLLVLAEEKDDLPALASYKPNSPTSTTPSPPPHTSSPENTTTLLSSTSATTVSSSVVNSDGRVISSPAARALAREKNIDINSVSASGPNNRIVLADVINAKPTTQVKTPSTAISKVAASGQQVSFTDIPVTTMRRVIAERLSESKSTIPHYYVTSALKVDRMLHLRKLLNNQSEDSANIRVSVNDMLVKASALAMRKVPAMNASWQGSFIRQYKDVDVCIAVATPTGLLTPSVRNAQSKGLAEISNESKRLANKAKIGSLTGPEMTGTFTISNLGMFGCVSDFSAIVNPPQAAILAVAGVEEVVVRGAKEGEFEVSQVMKVTLSCDHRVVDGAVAAEWMKEFKRIIEEPLNLMM